MSRQRKQQRLKAVISCLLLVVLLLISISGAMLYFGKTGLILGFSRAFLLHFHAGCAVLFVLLAACHLALNFKTLLAGFRGKKYGQL